MSIADFIRSFIENRRRGYETNAKYGNEAVYPSVRNENDKNKVLYSGDIDPDIMVHLLQTFGFLSLYSSTDNLADKILFTEKSDKDLDGKISSFGIGAVLNKLRGKESGDDKNPNRTITRKYGISRSIRSFTRPDGTVHTEIITKDAEGNTERKLMYKKDGKVITEITKTDPSGNVTYENQDADSNVNTPGVYIWRDFGSQEKSSDANSDDYWFDRLFGKENQPSDTFSSNQFVSPEVDKIEAILKNFGFDPFPGGPWKKFGKDSGSENSNSKSIFDDFFGQNGMSDDSSPFAEEARKFFEATEKQIKTPFEKRNKRRYSGKKNNESNKQSIMSRVFVDIGPAPPSLFERLHSRAMLELLDEQTPFDKYVKPDEDKLNKLKPLWKQTKQHLNKLEDYINKMNDGNNKSAEGGLNKFAKPEIMPPSSDLIFPKITDEFSSNKKSFETAAQISKNEIHYPDGRKRYEILKKDMDGNEEKTVVYQMGNKRYTVVTQTDKSGITVTRKNASNISADEFGRFSQLWDETDRSDFSK